MESGGIFVREDAVEMSVAEAVFLPPSGRSSYRAERNHPMFEDYGELAPGTELPLLDQRRKHTDRLLS